MAVSKFSIDIFKLLAIGYLDLHTIENLLAIFIYFLRSIFAVGMY